jgi:hypothetical protein
MAYSMPVRGTREAKKSFLNKALRVLALFLLRVMRNVAHAA